MQATHHKQKQERDKRQGTHDQRTRANLRQVLKPLHPAHLWTSGHDHRPNGEPHRKPLQALELKYILTFAVFGLPNSRENTKAHQIKIHFCPVLLKICHDGAGRQPDSREQEGAKESSSRSKEKPLCYRESIQQRTPTPPHLRSDKCLLPA